MTRFKACPTGRIFLLLVIFIPLLLSLDRAFAQESRGLAKCLTLPKDTKRPDPPRSDKAYFSEISKKSVLLEVLLNEDGSVLGFEKRTLGDAFNGTSHAKLLKWDGNIRALLRFAASQGDRIKLSEEEGAFELANVDFVIRTSSKTRLLFLQRLLMMAGEDGTLIYRIHLAVKDKETGEEGLLSYYLPSEIAVMDDPDDEGFLLHHYNVTIYAGPGMLTYALEGLGGSDEMKDVDSLEEVGKMMDKVKAQDPDATFGIAVGGIWLDEYGQPQMEPLEKHTATVQDLVDFMTYMASRGADLKCLKTAVTELVELEEVEEEDQ